MSLGLILEICFVWFLFLAAMGLVLINLSIDVGRVLKRTLKNPEQGVAQETKHKIKAPIWEPEINNAQVASTK